MVEPGLPLLTIDGGSPLPMVAVVLPADPEAGDNVLHPAREAGVRLFVLDVHLFETPHGLGYRDVPRVLERMAAVSPEARFILRLWLNPPESWLEAHPDDRYLLHPDRAVERMASFSSASWRGDVETELRRMIRHLRASRAAGRIIGFWPACGRDDAWMHPSPGEDFDYSQANLRAFRAYLRTLYLDDVERLRYAWNDPIARFESAAIPLPGEWAGSNLSIYRDERGPDRRARDYERFLSRQVADALLGFAEVLKETADLRCLVFARYGEIIRFAADVRGLQRSGALDLQRVLEDRSVDIHLVSYHAALPLQEFPTPQAQNPESHGDAWAAIPSLPIHSPMRGARAFVVRPRMPSDLNLLSRALVEGGGLIVHAPAEQSPEPDRSFWVHLARTLSIAPEVLREPETRPGTLRILSQESCLFLDSKTRFREGALQRALLPGAPVTQGYALFEGLVAGSVGPGSSAVSVNVFGPLGRPLSFADGAALPSIAPEAFVEGNAHPGGERNERGLHGPHEYTDRWARVFRRGPYFQVEVYDSTAEICLSWPEPFSAVTEVLGETGLSVSPDKRMACWIPSPGEAVLFRVAP